MPPMFVFTTELSEFTSGHFYSLMIAIICNSDSPHFYLSPLYMLVVSHIYANDALAIRTMFSTNRLCDFEFIVK